MKKKLTYVFALAGLLSSHAWGLTSHNHPQPSKASFTPMLNAEPSLRTQVGIGEKIVRPTQKKATAQDPSFFSPNASILHHETDATDGEVRFLGGKLGVSLSDPNTVQTVLNRLGLNSITVKKNLSSSHKIGSLTSEHYNRVIDGIAVDHAYLILRYQNGKLIHVVNKLFGRAKVTPFVSYSKSKLLERVTQDAGQKATFVKKDYRLEKTDSGYVFTPSIVASAEVKKPFGRWMYTLDVTDGRIIEIRNELHFLQGQVKASVFPRTVADLPVVRSMKFQKIKSSRRTAHANEEGYFDIPQNFGRQLTFSLDSKFFSITNKAGANQNARLSISNQNKNNFEVMWDDSNSTMAERNVVYHLDKIRHWAKAYYSAINVDNPFLNNSFPANVNIQDMCNAYYDRRSVNFFQMGTLVLDDHRGNKTEIACNNTGNIADVVYHEWGHALDDKLAGGILDGAYSEGIGDLVSLALTGSNLVGPHFMVGGAPVRDLEPNKNYPDDAHSEVHNEGLIIGSTYWDLYKELLVVHGLLVSQDLLAKYILYSILTSQLYTENYQAVLAVDGYTGDRDKLSPNFCLINDAFAAHGLAEPDELCIRKLVAQNHVFATDSGVVEAGDVVSFDLNMINNDLRNLNGVEFSLHTTSPAIALLPNNLSSFDFAPEQVQAVNGLQFALSTQAECNSEHRIDLLANYGTTLERTAFYFVTGEMDTANVNETSGTINQKIPDNNKAGLKSKIAFNQTNRYVSNRVTVTMNIQHKYRGDLRVRLASPSGKKLTIVDRQGRGADNIIGSFDIDGFAREPIDGEWTLHVADHHMGDAGTLVKWQLSIPGYRSSCQ